MNKCENQKFDEEIIRRYQDGESAFPIAKGIGISEKGVIYRLRVNGIKRRPRHQVASSLPRTKEWRAKLSATRIATGLAKGKNNPNWKGGRQDNWSKLKNSKEYKLWREAVYKRDNYICQGCGYSKGKVLCVHHILPRKDFPHLIFAINNGITLCRTCHRKTMGKEYHFVVHYEKLVNSGKPKFVKNMAIPSQAREGRCRDLTRAS